MLPIIQRITPFNRYLGREGKKIEYIVVHYFGALASAKNVADYWYNNEVEGSAHYLVDEANIYQSVNDEDTAWHCNDGSTGEYRLVCHNNNSIGIEMRPLKKDTNSLSVSDSDWYFDPKTIQNTLDLIKYLLVKYNLPYTKVIRHYDVSTKLCPRPFVGEDINTYYNKPGNVLWENFKEELRGEKMNQEEFEVMLNIALAKRATLPPLNWEGSSDARAWAEKNNLIAKDTNMRYQSYVTREEMIVFLVRLFDIVAKLFRR